MRDIKNDNSDIKTIDYSMKKRIDSILAALKSSSTPLPANGIKLPEGICTKQLKYWTLKMMARKKMIACKQINGVCHYFIKEGKR